MPNLPLDIALHILSLPPVELIPQQTLLQKLNPPLRVQVLVQGSEFPFYVERVCLVLVKRAVEDGHVQLAEDLLDLGVAVVGTGGKDGGFGL